MGCHVPTKAIARQMQDDNEQGHDDRGDTKYFDPAWFPIGWSAHVRLPSRSSHQA